MLSKDALTPSTFSEVIEMIDVALMRDRVDQVAQLERLRSVICKMVRPSSDPHSSEVCLLEQLEAVLASLKNGIVEVDALIQTLLHRHGRSSAQRPSLTLFGKRYRYR